MTDTVTPSPTVSVGQTWKRKNSAASYLVLHVAEVEGFTYVLYRLTFDEPGQLVRCAPLDEFTAEYEAPEWPTPEPSERDGYVIITYSADGQRGLSEPYESLAAARLDAADFFSTRPVAGIARARTVTTYEWVDADETGGE